MRKDLAEAYECPVLDIDGLHETRPIAVSPDGGPFRLLPRRVHVEIMNADGQPVPAGDHGEIVVTVGENPLRPLVRYRTADHARLVDVDGRPALADLEARGTVEFLAADGTRVPSVDLTQHLQAAGVRDWAVHQHADGSVSATIVGGSQPAVEAALNALLGQLTDVRPQASPDPDRKRRRYSGDA